MVVARFHVKFSDFAHNSMQQCFKNAFFYAESQYRIHIIQCIINISKNDKNKQQQPDKMGVWDETEKRQKENCMESFLISSLLILMSLYSF